MNRRTYGRDLAGGLLLLAVAVLPAVSAADQRSARQKDKTMDDKAGPIILTLTCDKEYVAGFPLIVAVELRNVSSNVFESFRRFGLFNAPGPVAFMLRGNGREWTWAEKPPQMEGEPRGVDFDPGRAWLALQDLSDLHPDIPPGHYQLAASAAFPGQVARSAPVSFEIRAASDKDRTTAERLRAANDLKTPSWRTFVRQNWSTPEASGLSSSARTDVAHHLAYYLYLHRVAYGPTPIAALDPEEPWHFAHSLLESEAAAVRLEILTAAHRPEAAGVEKAILERWPGLAWRVEEIHRGRGLLTQLRTSWGIERSDVPATGPRPYQSR